MKYLRILMENKVVVRKLHWK